MIARGTETRLKCARQACRHSEIVRLPELNS